MSFSFDAVYDIREAEAIPLKYPSALIIVRLEQGQLKRLKQLKKSYANTSITLVVLLGPNDEDLRKYLNDNAFSFLNFPPVSRELDMLVQYHGAGRKPAYRNELNCDRLLEDTLVTVQEGICLLDRDLTIVKTNHSIRERYRSKLPLEGVKCHYAFHDRTTRCINCPALRAMESGKLESAVIPGISPAGKNGWLELFANPVFDNEGKISGVIEFVRDITFKKELSEKFRNNEERYRKVFESLSMISVQGYNPNREVVFWNKASEALYGYTSEEALGRKLEDLIIPGDLKKKLVTDVNSFLEYNKPIPSSEYLLRRKDGSRVPVFTSSVIIENSAGEKELYSVDLDLSQLKRYQLIQAVLNEITASIIPSEDLFHFLKLVRKYLAKIINTQNFFIALYNESDNTFSLPIFIDDRDKFRSFPAGRTLTAYMISRNKPLLLNEEEIDKLEKLDKIDRVGSLCKQWLGIPLKRDSRVTGAIVLQSYTDDVVYDDTDMSTLLAVAEQISVAIDRKAHQEALRESERTLKTLISNLPGIAYRCRFDDLWTMEFLSDGFTILTGYPVEDCIENSKFSYSEIIHPDDRYKIREQVERAISFDEPYHLIARLITKGDVIKWVWEKGRAIVNEDKEVIALEGFIIDITDRIEMENQIISAKERAEESDRLKTAFLANLSHEIRSPMNRITGFSQLLKSENGSSPVSEYADIIHQSSCQLLDVITNIVDQARIDSGQVGIKKQSVNLTGLLERLKNHAHEQLLLYDNKQIDVSIHSGSDDADSFIITDDGLVFKIISHIVNNAVKFTRAGKIEIGYDITENLITFFVKDTGIGISPQYYDVIFERFRQVDEGITRRYDGAGLGLSVAKGIASLLGGDIRVAGKEGMGAEFYLTLPV